MKRILLLTTSSAFLFLVLTSSSFGPGGQGINGTGSPGNSGNCSSCHSGGSGITTGMVEVRKLSTGITGPIVTQYFPDTNYILKVTGNNPNLSHFGFQLTALKSNNTSAGTFTVTGNIHISALSSKDIVEHSAALPKTNNEYEAVFNWKAPAAGTGNVTLYGVINAVNLNSQQLGDKPGNPFTLVLTEAAPLTVNTLPAEISITTYPNPVTDQLNISLKNVDNGLYTINVFDINGKVLSTQTATITNSYQMSINTSTWAAGIYHLQLKKDGAQRTIKVVK